MFLVDIRRRFFLVINFFEDGRKQTSQMLDRILNTSLSYLQTIEIILFLENIITEHYRKITEQTQGIDSLTTNVLPYRNQSIDLLCKSVKWFHYERGICR